MTADAPALPRKVTNNLAAMGDVGAAWLARLPALVEDLQVRWDLRVGATMPNATEAYVAETVAATGELGALKVPIPGAGKAQRELGVLLAADGRGYARVLQHDPASGAMHLERLGPQLFQLGYPTQQQIEVICATLLEARRPPPVGLKLLTGAEKAQAMAQTVRSITARFPGACSARGIEVALRFAAQRRDAFDPAACVLGHGDAHCWNTLQDPRTGGFKFVDPDGLFIEPAHDLSITLREGCNDFLAGDPVALGHSRCDLLATLASVDADAIWQWGLLENLVNGLLYLDVGAPDDAAPFLAVAEAWARAEPN